MNNFVLGLLTYPFLIFVYFLAVKNYGAFMCGRFETKPSIQSLVEALRQENIELYPDLSIEANKTTNISPTDKIFSITLVGGIYTLSLTNWGIKFSDDSPLIFNSRIETIKEKKFWSNLFNNNRALVPMSGFYEWKKEGSRRQPYRIFLPGNNLFFVSALYYIDKGKIVFTSLITTTPNEFIRPIHHRMPVILNIKDGISYLTDAAESNLLRCIPYARKMAMERVVL
jgi:putative SOS response-associated peptidase YedK